MASSAASSSRRSKMDGTLVGDYKIGPEIGKGSFASVYKGVERGTNALVAIKSVNLGKLNKKLKDNLYSEIHILKTLQHPHIVSLMDCRETSSHIHLVMEYCELGDLSYFIKKRDTLAANPALADMTRKYPNPEHAGLNEVVTRHFLKQLASALEFLRRKNFIHRDVKPQNLLLNPSRRYLATAHDTPLIKSVSENSGIPMAGLESLPMLKLADFGFARSLPSTSLAETLCGSPLYMAPEILRYEKYDAKADLWSVGTVLYEMVTGKPPFRAANHVELLRKIEQSLDQIRFSSSIEVSSGMKALIRALLKRNPVERMSFDNFFANEVITERIPGLVEDDLPKRPSIADRSSGTATGMVQRQLSTTGGRQTLAEVDESRDKVVVSSSPKVSKPGNTGSPVGTPPRPSRPHSGSNPLPPSRRPVLHPAVTAPNVVTAGGTKMERDPSQNTASPGSSLLGGNAKEVGRQEPERQKIKIPPTPQEVAAQEALTENEYVLIEKRSVEVNAFADQMAANHRLHAQTQVTSPKTGIITRRATTQGQPGSLTGAIPPRSSHALQVAQGKPRPADHQRTGSYEPRFSPSPTSATSAISKAIAGASLRLFGISVDKISPQMFGGGNGTSPPHFYSPFPVYPSNNGISGLIADGKTNANLDEDSKAVMIIEESATRSDVVYGFAEVKYRQLIPSPPSVEHGIGGRLAETPEGEDSYELLPEATVGLSEEALVLYVKSLALLAKAMDYASAWWARRNRGEVISSGNSPRSNQASVIAAGNRINNAVQWVRSRFNEVLEKAEFVRLKLLEAQKQLPEDHPGHPSNHTSASRLAGGSSTDGVILSSGVTAEKLMYDRALEMSRQAAIDEISNTDLAQCELSYVTAIRMLEAVLEQDDDLSMKPTTAWEKMERDEMNGINIEDREAVQKVVTMIRTRLHSLRKKMAVLAKLQPSSLPQRFSRPSSTHSSSATPTINSMSPK